MISLFKGYFMNENNPENVFQKNYLNKTLRKIRKKWKQFSNSLIYTKMDKNKESQIFYVFFCLN